MLVSLPCPHLWLIGNQNRPQPIASAFCLFSSTCPCRYYHHGQFAHDTVDDHQSAKWLSGTFPPRPPPPPPLWFGLPPKSCRGAISLFLVHLSLSLVRRKHLIGFFPRFYSQDSHHTRNQSVFLWIFFLSLLYFPSNAFPLSLFIAVGPFQPIGQVRSANNSKFYVLHIKDPQKVKIAKKPERQPGNMTVTNMLSVCWRHLIYSPPLHGRNM